MCLHQSRQRQQTAELESRSAVHGQRAPEQSSLLVSRFVAQICQARLLLFTLLTAKQAATKAVQAELKPWQAGKGETVA